MGRLVKDVKYKKRGKTWYYQLKGMSNLKTTRQTNKTAAERYVHEILQKQGFVQTTEQLFQEYDKDFFIWDRCPHARRLREEGKTITKRYTEIQRMNLEKYILPSNLRLLKINEIRRAHIIDFRSSLTRKNLAASTVNKIMSCLKVILNEALFREDILTNPAQSVGNVQDQAKEIDTFTLKELKDLFPTDHLKVWQNHLDYTCFFLTTHTGMRRGEVLALRWKHISFEQGYISIEESWKNKTEIGKPKWEHQRHVFLTNALKSLLLRYWEDTHNRNPEDLVFSHADGSRLGETWWKKHFDNALIRAGINRENRRLRPHSLRHTLNTLLLDNGVDPEKVRASLGWRDDAIQARYTHWKPEHLKGQGKILDNILSG
jgi:integrase